MINEPSAKQQPTPIILKDGTKEWWLNGKLHREDGPAIEYADGTKEWRRNGKLHREDGPAIEWEDGTRRWFVKGKLHREDGPAVELPGGTKWWYLNGVEVVYKFPFSLKKKKVGDLVFIKKQPAIITEIGCFVKVFINNKEVIYLRPEAGT